MKKDYLSKLERAARWQLPRQEAEDVLADYRDIIGDPPRRSEELYRDLGKPWNVIRPLAAPRAYYTWLAAFTVMAVCILVPGLSGITVGVPLWYYLDDGWTNHLHSAPFAILGAVAALVWFRWQGWKEKRLPKAIPILLAVFLVFIGWVLWFCWACSRDFDGVYKMWGQVRILTGPLAGNLTSASFYLSRITMAEATAPIALIGVFALVKARTGDRRWAAVYLLALTAILTALTFLARIYSMALSADFGIEEFFRWVLNQCSIVAAVGVAGTGVALC